MNQAINMCFKDIWMQVYFSGSVTIYICKK